MVGIETDTVSSSETRYDPANIAEMNQFGRATVLVSGACSPLHVFTRGTVVITAIEMISCNSMCEFFCGEYGTGFHMMNYNSRDTEIKYLSK